VNASHFRSGASSRRLLPSWPPKPVSPGMQARTFFGAALLRRLAASSGASFIVRTALVIVAPERQVGQREEDERRLALLVRRGADAEVARRDAVDRESEISCGGFCGICSAGLLMRRR
jgi:hypothetical protein